MLEPAAVAVPYVASASFGDDVMETRDHAWELSSAEAVAHLALTRGLCSCDAVLGSEMAFSASQLLPLHRHSPLWTLPR